MTLRPSPPVDAVSPSVRIVYSVAEQTNTDPRELPPLYDTIDTDALNRLLTTLDDAQIQFEYAGQVVTVQGTGAIHVTNASTTHAPQTD